MPRIDSELDRLVAQLNLRCAEGSVKPRGAARASLGGDHDLLMAALSSAAKRTDELTVIDVEGDYLDLSDLRESARLAGAPVAASGWATHPLEPPRPVAIIGPRAWAEPVPAPPSFSVGAVMMAYNEADIIRSSIEHLIEQGIEVHLIDNCSTDGTAEAVQDLVGTGVRAIERFPSDGRSERYDWTGLLRRGEQVAADMPHDWCVLHDVDERRDSPWPGISYRDAFFNVDRLGFTAADHTIFQFRPTDDSFRPGDDFSARLTHFELVPGARVAVNVKAWRNDGPVDLASSGGHDVQFSGRAVFPLNFALRHYPIRSQSHGEAKVFRDRQPRYEASELAKGWHYHYARLHSGHRFLYDPDQLEPYNPSTFDDDYLLPRLARLGIPTRDPGTVAWVRSAGVAGLRRLGLLHAAGTLKRLVRG